MLLKPYYVVIFAMLLFSCGSYKQSILFKVGSPTSLKEAATTVEKNYTITKNDVLSLRVYTKNGEHIIDPENKLLQSASGQQQAKNFDDEKFLVDQNGVAKLPMLGEVKLEGLTLREAEQLLQKEFSRFYNDVFVTIQCMSHQVIVLGAPGGQVIPLTHENTTLVEVLAISKAFMTDGKANSIRLLRGNEVYMADFSTVEGYQKGNYVVQTGDVVYIEPVRRPAAEAVRDYGSLVTIASTLILLIITLTN